MALVYHTIPRDNFMGLLQDVMNNRKIYKFWVEMSGTVQFKDCNCKMEVSAADYCFFILDL